MDDLNEVRSAAIKRISQQRPKQKTSNLVPFVLLLAIIFTLILTK